jgi:acyl carrier protein
MSKNLKRNEIFKVIRDSLKETAEVNDIPIEGEISEKTPFYGQKGLLDSIALVSLIVSVEERLSEMGYNVTIASEKAFSRKISPFLNIRTLVNFIEELLDE